MADPTPWKVLSTETVYDNAPWLTVHSDRIRTPSGHLIEAFNRLVQPDWINVVAVTEANTVLVNRQYRHGVGRVVDELPSGVIDDGESPATACLRELREETGYAFEGCTELVSYSPNPARVTNCVRGFLATGGRYVGAQELDASEEISVREVSVAEFRAMIEGGRFENAMHLATGWAALSKLEAFG